jgi:hypothetical protein
LLISCFAGSCVLLLLAFSRWMGGEPHPADDSFLEAVLTEKGGVLTVILVFLSLMLLSLLAVAGALVMGILGIVRGGANTTLALPGTLVSVAVLVWAFLGWVLPSYRY